MLNGFDFGLGHGVGLEAHEPPGSASRATTSSSRATSSRSSPGIEGIEGIGGVRFEDLLLITEDGSETLTDYPYDLDARPAGGGGSRRRSGAP